MLHVLVLLSLLMLENKIKHIRSASSMAHIAALGIFADQSHHLAPNTKSIFIQPLGII